MKYNWNRHEARKSSIFYEHTQLLWRCFYVKLSVLFSSTQMIQLEKSVEEFVAIEPKSKTKPINTIDDRFITNTMIDLSVKKKNCYPFSQRIDGSNKKN